MVSSVPHAQKLISRVLIATLLLGTIGVVGFAYISNHAKVRRAKEELLPKVAQLSHIEEDIFMNVEAYRLAEEAEEYIPEDSTLARLFSRIAIHIVVRTDPPGAKVFMKPFGAADSSWRYVGVTPLEHLRVPKWCLEFKLERDGYETDHAAALTALYSRAGWIPDTLERTLEPTGVMPPGMIRVSHAGILKGIGPVADFYIDRDEVTNEQFKEFIDKGGYQRKEYWRQPFFEDAQPVSWEDAMRMFVDQSGQPGPSTWQAGTFPVGQENYPVAGISWYEAAAFAEYAGKVLPSVYHWDVARGGNNAMLRSRMYSILFLSPLSNLQGKGPAPVGSFGVITAYGAHDMAGNVREWCWNASEKGRTIVGGAWDDVPYMFDYWSQASPFNRAPKNGFRCARYLYPERIPEKMFQSVRAKEMRDFARDKPVSDAIFQNFKKQYSYNRTPLDARIEWRKDDAADWIQERISLNAAYGNERVAASLFLPRHSSPPYQTIVYFPGGFLAAMMRSSEDLEHYRDFTQNLEFLLRSGRAVLFPIYKGTFERGSDQLMAMHPSDTTQEAAELFIEDVKDLRRCLDYLELRPDINVQKLAYFGFCWGGWYGGIIPAVEPRLKASILEMAGFWDFSRPEVNEFNYVTRVKIPTLMLSGRYDSMFPLEVSARPMFELLGTPSKNKRLIVYATDHFIPQNEMMRESLDWLDRYLGPP